MPKKGSNFERLISKELSLWWTSGKRDDVFWRTSNSGGRATVRRKCGKGTRNQEGDLCATDPIGKKLLKLMVLELKCGSHGRATVADLLDTPKTSKIQTYHKWILQAQASQENSRSKSWAIIHKRDRRDAIILIPEILWEILLVQTKENLEPAFTIHLKRKGLVVDLVAMKLKYFLNSFSKETCKLALIEWNANDEHYGRDTND